MKLIIAGSRSITDYAVVCKAIGETLSVLGIMSLADIEVVSGNAGGVDTLGERWANENHLALKLFPAKWADIVTLPVKIKRNKFGKEYNALAGFNRNAQMADYAHYLLAVWDGKSPGTEHMIRCMATRGKPRLIYDASTGTLLVRKPNQKG
jgi:hypothetical protein